MPYNEIFVCLTSERDGHLVLLSGFSNDPVCLHIVDLKRVEFFPFIPASSSNHYSFSDYLVFVIFELK